MRNLEHRCLQVAVAVATLVPILAGAAGVFRPSAPGGDAAATSMDSHHRYLWGVLFAIGVAFVSTIPRIELHTARFRLLTALVVTGGVVRLGALVAGGRPTGEIVFALVMELGVTPGLMLWQSRIAASGASSA
jgi:hypothetical protein